MSQNPRPRPRRLDRTAVIRLLAEGVRASMGDRARYKERVLAAEVLARRCTALAAADPAYGEAIRAAIEQRLASVAACPEAREKILTQPDNPIHPYWLLTLSDIGLRHLNYRANTPGPEAGGLPAIFEMIGLRVRPGGPGDGPDGDGGDDPAAGEGR